MQFQHFDSVFPAKANNIQVGILCNRMNERNYLKFPYTKTRAMSQQTNAWNEWIVLTTQSF